VVVRRWGGSRKIPIGFLCVCVCVCVYMYVCGLYVLWLMCAVTNYRVGQCSFLTLHLHNTLHNI
jgi:hypothetical protein